MWLFFMIGKQRDDGDDDKPRLVPHGSDKQTNEKKNKPHRKTQKMKNTQNNSIDTPLHVPRSSCHNRFMS